MEYVINPFKVFLEISVLAIGFSLFGLFLFVVDIKNKGDAFSVGMDIVVMTSPLAILAIGAFSRDVKHWSTVVIKKNHISSIVKHREACSIDLQRTTYYARLMIPNDRFSVYNVFVVSNEPFSVPRDKPYRFYYDKTTQVLVILTSKCPYAFPQKEWVCVQGPNANDWL